MGTKVIAGMREDGIDAIPLRGLRVKTRRVCLWPIAALLLCGGALTACSEEAPPSPGTVFRDCPVCPEMVVIPPGSFMMGSPSDEKGREKSEGPQHRVTIARPFALGKYEVTFAEWRACVADGGCKSVQDERRFHNSRLPADEIQWYDAQDYIFWLRLKTGKAYRLPSEAEWEYAARAGSTTRYSWGDKVGRDNATCNRCGRPWYYEDPKPVGSFAPNAFGLYDMHGNLGEWTEDCRHDDYVGAPVDGSAWTGFLSGWFCDRRIVRGGHFASDREDIRSARRSASTPSGSRGFGSFGLRVARDF